MPLKPYLQGKFDALRNCGECERREPDQMRSMRQSNRLSLTGDVQDALLYGGVNTWNLGWTAGRVGFDNTAAQLLDANTAATRGGFSKLNANFARYQNLGPKDGLYMAFSGQLASTNLDSSQKMSVGEPNSVRAYDAGAVSGDSGYWEPSNSGTTWARLGRGNCRRSLLLTART